MSAPHLSAKLCGQRETRMSKNSQNRQFVITQLPDAKLTPEVIFADGDRVVAHVEDVSERHALFTVSLIIMMTPPFRRCGTPRRPIARLSLARSHPTWV